MHTTIIVAYGPGENERMEGKDQFWEDLQMEEY